MSAAPLSSATSSGLSSPGSNQASRPTPNGRPPAAAIGGSVLLAVLCVIVWRPRAALFALVAAPAAAAVTELVLKPLVHREQHVDALLFPSGHTTGAFALALSVVVLLLPREGT